MSSRSGVTIALATLLVLASVLGASRGVAAASATIVVGQSASGANGVNLYNPSSVSILTGDSVTWNSAPDGRSHDVTSFAESSPGTPLWQAPTLRSTGTNTFSRTFTTAGLVTFYCSFHATQADADPAVIDASIAAGKMVGKILVSAPAADTTAPTVSAVSATPNPTAGAASVSLSALVTDAGTPASNIAAAEYSVGAAAAVAGSGSAMVATDGAFNSPSEPVSATVSVASYAAGTTITVWVRGKDAAGNWSAAVSVAVSVTAAPAGSVPINVTVNGGSLTNTTAPLALGAIALTGADLLLNTSAATWRAIDARGTGAGWNVSVSSSDFTASTGGIAVANFKVRLPAASIVKVAGNASPTSGATTYQPLGTTPLKLLSAGTGQGMGTYDYTPDWQLAVPAQTFAGSFAATLVVTINSGP